MVGIYEERRSSSARWCQRFALFLIPFFLLVILLYRFDQIATLQLFVLLGIGLVIAVLGVVLAIAAVSELWNKGYRGGTQVVRGMIVILLVLLPFGYYSYLALLFPLANDVSTDTFLPPQYIAAVDVRRALASDGVNPVLEYTSEYSDLIVQSYPKLRSRRYPAGPERVLEAVIQIVRDNDWPIIASSGFPEQNESSDEEISQDNQEETLEDNVVTPEDIYVEVLDKTLIFGFENDVIIRIISEDQNTLVDIRSSSRWGKHDFGYNARLIQNFLGALDAGLLGIAGEG